MSVDLQDAIRTIREMTSMVVPDDDFIAVDEIEQQLGTTEAGREKELEIINEKLRVLSRTLEAAKISSSRPSTVPSAEGHVKIMNELDNTRLRLAKAINSAESGLASKESELAKLKEEFKEFEQHDVAKQAGNELDGSTLRLAMWKAMGFEPVVDNNGKLNKMLVRSQSGDVHCITFDGTRSEYEYGQELWHLATE